VLGAAVAVCAEKGKLGLISHLRFSKKINDPLSDYQVIGIIK